MPGADICVKDPFGFFLKTDMGIYTVILAFYRHTGAVQYFYAGEALFVLRIAGIKFIITRQGLFGAALFVTRVATSVSYVVLLSITTRHFELLRVLRIFKIPQIFVMTLGMCYRYIYLFVEIVENTYLAIKGRVGSRVHYKKGRHIVAWNIAYLWVRSYQLNEDVYKAMLSRGYTGEPLVLNNFKARLKDWLWLFGVIVAFAGIFYLNYQIKI